MHQLGHSEEELVSLLGRAVKDVWWAIPPFAQIRFWSMSASSNGGQCKRLSQQS